MIGSYKEFIRKMVGVRKIYIEFLLGVVSEEVFEFEFLRMFLIMWLGILKILWIILLDWVFCWVSLICFLFFFENFSMCIIRFRIYRIMIYIWWY